MKLIPEWYEHQYCLIAWPCNKDLYGKIINKARDEVANVINEIAKTEQVIVLSNKEDICSHLTVCHHEFILTFVIRKQLLNGSLQVKHAVGNGPQSIVLYACVHL